MNWALVILLAYFFIAALINVGRVGKVREVKTPRVAICDAIEFFLLGALAVWAVNW